MVDLAAVDIRFSHLRCRCRSIVDRVSLQNGGFNITDALLLLVIQNAIAISTELIENLKACRTIIPNSEVGQLELNCDICVEQLVPCESHLDSVIPMQVHVVLYLLVSIEDSL